MKKGVELPKVKDIYNKDINTLFKEQSVLEAIKVFNQNFSTLIPIVNKDKDVIGILSESDCLKVMSDSLFFNELVPSVEFIMTENIIYAHQDLDLFELKTLLESKGISSAPVINHKNKLIGIISRHDILLTLEKIMMSRCVTNKVVEGLQVKKYPGSLY